MKNFLIILFLSVSVSNLFAQNADVIKSDALMAQSVDDFASAAELFASAATAYEDAGIFDTLSVYQAGVNYNRIKEYDKALDFFTKLKAENINTIEVALAMSDSYIGTKELDKAITVLEDHLDEDSNLSSIYRKLSVVTFNAKKPDKAL